MRKEKGINKRKTNDQIKNKEHNDSKIISCPTGRAKYISKKIKKNPRILTKVNPDWTSQSKFHSFCLIKYFGKTPTAKQREEELKDFIDVLRTESIDFVAGQNRKIMFLENELRLLQENKKGELGILKRPENLSNTEEVQNA